MIQLYYNHHLQPIISIIILVIIIPNNVICWNNNNNPHMVHHECTRNIKKNSYASGDLFEANLNATLLRPLSPKAAFLGFLKNTTGEGSDRVYSVFYCHGHITGNHCRSCFKAAGRDVLRLCHLLKEGIVWYQECTLHYSSKKNVVFSTEEVSLSLRHLSYNFSSSLKRNLDGEEEKFKELMNGLIEKASAYSNNNNDDDDGTIQRFATGETPLSHKKMTLSGVVQCRPDLVSGACQTCLRSALKQMDKWSITMVFLASCNFKFYLYPSHHVKTSASSGRDRKSIKNVTIPAMVVGSFLVFYIIMNLVICYARKQQWRINPPSNGEARHAVGRPWVENYYPTYPPSLQLVNVHTIDNYWGTNCTISTRSYATTSATPNWTSQNMRVLSPEPTAPPLPGGHANKQIH